MTPLPPCAVTRCPRRATLHVHFPGVADTDYCRKHGEPHLKDARNVVTRLI